MRLRERPVLVYDGDCGFCTRAVRWAQRLPVDVEVEVVAWQHADLPALGLSRAAATGAVQWVDVDGGTKSGHAAAAALLVASGRPWSWLGRLALAPGLSWLGAGTYRLVSANRQRLPGGTPACALPPERRPGARG